jgi:O-antigen/teichoic acid export membrane protein
MQKKFLSNLFITLITNLLVKPVWILGIDRTFQNRLGLAEYGMYTSLFTFSIVLGLLLDFGINNYNSASLARDPAVLQKQFMPLILIKSGLGVLYISVTLMLGFWYGFNGESLWLLGVLCVNQCLSYASTFFRSTLTGLQLYRTDALISSVDRFTMIIAGTSVLIFAVFPVSVPVFIYLQTAGYVVAALVSLLTLLPHIHHIGLRLPLIELRPVLVKSLPFAVLTLLMALYSRIDVLMIKKLLPEGDVENGIYAQSTRLVDAVNMLAVLVSGLLLPMLSSMLAKKEPVTPLVKMAMLVLWVPAILGVTVCYGYGTDIMQILYKTTNPYHTVVFVLCISTVLPMCMMYVFGTLLTAAGNLKQLIFISVGALLINMVSNYYVVPKMGVEGAAWVAIITHSFVAVLNMIVAFRRLPVFIPVLHLVKFVVLAVAAYVVLRAGIFLGFGFVTNLLVFLTVSAGLVLVLQLIDSDTLKRALKRFR